MNKVILICAFLAITLPSTFNNKQTLVASSSNSNLGFNNYTGPGITQAMLTSFTNFANGGSSFFKDDVAANAKYIKQQMDKLYGVRSAIRTARCFEVNQEYFAQINRRVDEMNRKIRGQE